MAYLIFTDVDDGQEVSIVMGTDWVRLDAGCQHLIKAFQEFRSCCLTELFCELRITAGTILVDVVDEFIHRLFPPDQGRCNPLEVVVRPTGEAFQIIVEAINVWMRSNQFGLADIFGDFIERSKF